MSVEGPDADLTNLNYSVLIPYNGTVPTGGDSHTQNLNVFFEVRRCVPQRRFWCRNPNELQSGDIGWMITATALVLLMIPGVG